MRISRRESFAIMFAVARDAARAVARAETSQIQISLVPIFTKHDKAPSDDLIAGAGHALETTYRVTTHICEPEFYGGTDDGFEMLAFLGSRRERAMGVLSGPLRARTPAVSKLRNVCGYANTPSDDVEQPLTSVITMHEFWSLNAERAKRALGVVAVHELGHNFGAWDCRNPACLMCGQVDTVSMLQPSKFCETHANILWQYLR